MAKALAPTDGRRNCGNYNCRRTWLLPWLQQRTTKSELRVAQWQAQLCGSSDSGSSPKLSWGPCPRDNYMLPETHAQLPGLLQHFVFTFLFEQIAGNFALTDWLNDRLTDCSGLRSPERPGPSDWQLARLGPIQRPNCPDPPAFRHPNFPTGRLLVPKCLRAGVLLKNALGSLVSNDNDDCSLNYDAGEAAAAAAGEAAAEQGESVASTEAACNIIDLAAFTPPLPFWEQGWNFKIFLREFFGELQGYLDCIKMKRVSI